MILASSSDIQVATACCLQDQPHGTKDCPHNCNGVGVCQADFGYCLCPAGKFSDVFIVFGYGMTGHMPSKRSSILSTASALPQGGLVRGAWSGSCGHAPKGGRLAEHSAHRNGWPGAQNVTWRTTVTADHACRCFHDRRDTGLCRFRTTGLLPRGGSFPLSEEGWTPSRCAGAASSFRLTST